MTADRTVSVYLRIKPPENPRDPLCIKIRSSDSISITDTTVYSSPIEALYSCDGVIGPDETLDVMSFPNSASSLFIGYGHSGSGKTHTMFGAGGVLNGIVEKFFCGSCTLEFFEIYNEKICDLLNIRNQALPVRDDGSIPQLTTVSISSISELVSVVEIGLSNRAVSENAIHAHSSRSHAILRLCFPSNQTITIVDLAGSERSHVSYKQQRGRRQSELHSIHKSLHALRHCVMELGHGRYGKFSLPMRRTSILTKILFSSNLAIGHCVLIACISPEKTYERETLSTLDFVSAGLNLNSWWRKSPVNHSINSVKTCHVSIDNSTSELELLKRTVLDLQQELRYERQRRVELESRCDSPPPPPLTDLSYRRPARKLTDESLTPIIVESTMTPSLVETSPVAKFQPGKKILSQEWRHSQYDEILKKLWKSTPSNTYDEVPTPPPTKPVQTTRITTLIPLLPG